MQQFKAQKGRPRGDLPALIAELGLEPNVLNQPWVELSVRTFCCSMAFWWSCLLRVSLAALSVRHAAAAFSTAT